MGFIDEHRVKFHETDAAGVVYFANGLVMCHAAYEASLEGAGIDLTRFFTATVVAYPIVHTAMDYRRPLRCGDTVQIELLPTRLDDFSFEIHYRLKVLPQGDTLVGEALTRHVCIDTTTRARRPLPVEMEQWLQRWAD